MYDLQVASVAVATGFVVITSKTLSQYNLIDKLIHSEGNAVNFFEKVAWVFAFEHFIILFKLVLALVIPDFPSWIMK